MVDALGGVSVCVVPTAATAAAAEPLPPGSSEVSGDAAAGFLQPGDAGADVTGAAVAERAQRLLTSTLRSALSPSTLADPLTLTRFLTRAADALTVDEADHPRATSGCWPARWATSPATPCSGRRCRSPRSTTCPPAPTRPAYVLLDGVATRSLFDTVIGEHPGARGAARRRRTARRRPRRPPRRRRPRRPAAPEPATTGLTVAPDQITVDVLNGTATNGLAATVADQLRAQGFTVATSATRRAGSPRPSSATARACSRPARTVAAAVPGAVLEASDAIGDTVQLVIGPGYETVVPVTLGAPRRPRRRRPSRRPRAEPQRAPAPVAGQAR